jgi:RNA polymerase sigma factor (sigma-70 family)
MNEKSEQLVIDYMPLAKSICKKFPNIDYSERYSIALYNLVLAAESFDYDNYNLSRFYSYARTTIVNALKKYYNKSHREVTIDWSAVESPDDYQPTMLKYLEEVDNNFYNSEFLTSCKTILSDKKFKILKMIICDKNQVEIAEEIETSQATVSRRINEIRNELYEIKS